MKYFLRVIWFYDQNFWTYTENVQILFQLLNTQNDKNCYHSIIIIVIKTVIHQKHNAEKYNFIDSLTCF